MEVCSAASRPCLARENPSVFGYNYADEGAYFVTVCLSRRECLLGEVNGFQFGPSAYGEIVEDCWKTVVGGEPFDFVMMPNHVHGVVFIQKGDHER